MITGIPANSSQDDITTIFVVGFPEDMAEREFQNMFIFCPGFEAAALKIPLGNEIGFAKFTSIVEALQARNVLNGRKVDIERGCVIKAEMAKKNLHTKRAFNVPDIKIPINLYSRYASNDQYYEGLRGDYVQHEANTNHDSETYPISNGKYANNVDNADIFDPFGPSYPVVDCDLNGRDQFYASDTCLSPYEDFDSKVPAFGTSQSSRGFSSGLYNSDELLSRSLGSMSMNDLTGQEYFGGRSSSISYSTAYPVADQNPPCNTLYVGNLPNGSCEEELRTLFQSCPGYKRLSFKTRINGPMCFVEFDDVTFATQALFHLYGNYLSNSTKGGIRLSYSKNPLGVRQAPLTCVTNLLSEALHVNEKLDLPKVKLQLAKSSFA